MTGQHQRWREASAAPAEQMDSASRCLACGLPITSEQQVSKSAAWSCICGARFIGGSCFAGDDTGSLENRRRENTMSNEIKVLYTAEAVAQGGRAGHARTSDGRVDVDLDVPTEMGGSGGPGTNPEELFAAGYAACFQSALLRHAAGRKVDLTGTRIIARVGIGTLRAGGFGLRVALDLDAPEVGRDEAFELMMRAHEDCPYSRATRGNIDVSLSVGGSSVERKAA
jgi:lipoyl-dependent peroxiredoxin